MASVWYAENSVGRPFAIKLLKPEIIAQEPTVADRFRNEAQIMVKLDHPTVVRVEDYYEHDGTLAIIMEYLAGHDLHRTMRQQGPIPEQQALGWFADILDAFQYVHEKGYFHRDVKPANLFLTNTGKIKVMDFGIAKIVGSDLSLTQTDLMMGSPLYMSPEQILSPKAIDFRTDIYSLGVTLYTLLSGAKPYDDQQKSAFAVQTAIVQEPLPRLPHISAVVNDAIQQATQKKPADRFADCRAFALALGAATAPAMAATPTQKLQSQPEKETITVLRPKKPDTVEAETVLRPTKPDTTESATVLQYKTAPTTASAPAISVPTDAVLGKSQPASRSRTGLIVALVVGGLALGAGAFWLMGKTKTDTKTSAALEAVLAKRQADSLLENKATGTDSGATAAIDPASLRAVERGIAFYGQQRYDSARAVLTRYQDTPAFHANPEAMTDLGIIYFFGSENIPPDLPTAQKWLQKGADGNNAKAHYYLGLLLDGVDFKTVTRARGQNQAAVDAYRTGAEAGDSFAQNAIGELYLAGNTFLKKDDPCTIRQYLQQASTDPQAAEAKDNLAQFRKLKLCKNP